MEWGSLPLDLQEEILSRVPAKSLARLRSTSKRWDALLKSRSFTKIHSANAPKESMVTMLTGDKVYLARFNLHGINNNVAPSLKLTSQLYLKDPHICNVFHCDGLLLLSTFKENRLEVWNPCSGETKFIKPRNNYFKESDLYALGYDNRYSCKKYKVLRVDRQDPVGGIYNYEYEIYDFTNESWKVLGVTTEWGLDPNDRGVSLKGNTYWVPFSKGPWGYHKFLLCFDFSTEEVQSMSLPQPFPYLVAALSVVREEQLCLFGYFDFAADSAELHVWMTTSIGSVMSWSKFFTVKTNGSWDLFVAGMMSFLADEQNKVLVCFNNGIYNNFFYIVGETNQIQDVDDHCCVTTSRSYCSVLMNYVPSLAQI
ncbi:PREDICTED: putative F-box protein At3g23260 [Camelina sativa]|uniref:F-box protein At3g23260 n=1 Tax=Camelina sativa TaxID=90675 RepID=A0ABM0XRX0_CAMSA|nr:PREDICTED: putative F-box protein At3g23260 [Camelina sativa]